MRSKLMRKEEERRKKKMMKMIINKGEKTKKTHTYQLLIVIDRRLTTRKLSS